MYDAVCLSVRRVRAIRILIGCWSHSTQRSILEFWLAVGVTRLNILNSESRMSRVGALRIRTSQWQELHPTQQQAKNDHPNIASDLILVMIKLHGHKKGTWKYFV